MSRMNEVQNVSALGNAIYSIAEGAAMIDRALLTGTDEEIEESLVIVEESVRIIRTWLTHKDDDDEDD